MTLTVNRRTLAFLALAVLGILAAYLVGTSRSSVAHAATSALAPVATSSNSSDGITVTGTGKVTGTPDSLHISLAVSQTSANIDDALSAANKTMSAVQASLADHGVEAKDMQTSGLSIQPNYSNKGAPDGYLVSENLTATIKDLVKAGAALTAAVDAGGNAVRVDGVSVALDDTSGLVAGARTQAVEDAKTKATQYAKAAGRDLGDVVSISEIVSSPVSPMYDTRAAMATAASGVPIQAGTQDVSVQVTVVYALA